MQDRDVVKT